MRIRVIAAALALGAIPAAAQDTLPPMPDNGAWYDDFWANSSALAIDPQPKSCGGSLSVIDLDRSDVRRVDTGPHVRYLLANVGPRDGSAPAVLQLVQQRRAPDRFNTVAARFSLVPDATGDAATALFARLSDPSTRAAAENEMRGRAPSEKFYLRCPK